MISEFIVRAARDGINTLLHHACLCKRRLDLGVHGLRICLDDDFAVSAKLCFFRPLKVAKCLSCPLPHGATLFFFRFRLEKEGETLCFFLFLQGAQVCPPILVCLSRLLLQGETLCLFRPLKVAKCAKLSFSSLLVARGSMRSGGASAFDRKRSARRARKRSLSPHRAPSAASAFSDDAAGSSGLFEPAEEDAFLPMQKSSAQTAPAAPVCVFITVTKLFAGGGGGEWTTCDMIDDEPRPVWMSPLVTH
jgi:hypothetical protein